MTATKGWKGDLRIGDTSDLSGESDEGYIENVETNLDGGLEELYELGGARAYTIVDEPLLPPQLNVTANFARVNQHSYG